MRDRQPIRQIAYFVPDVRAAAARHHALLGSGPYFLLENIALTRCEYRGRPATLDHSSAYGQWGTLMIEFCQQNNAGPSVFHDLYPDGGEGLHHVALMVDDLGTAMREFEAAGHPAALYAELASGNAYAMMDCTRDYGHFVELYEASQGLLAFYETVRAAAEGFDGTELIRKLQA
ncbi:VOC family protein [Sphingosinicellaceae bacterium]|nr:VOC family protein [Sphingosinicellaceae bacterium]